MRNIHAFNDGYLADQLEHTIQLIRGEITSEKDELILGTEEEKYVAYVLEKFRIDDLSIDFDHPFVEQYEKNIPANQHPYGVFLIDEDDSRSFRRNVIVCHLPVAGSVNLLNFIPNPRIVWSIVLDHHLNETGQTISFEIIDFSNNATEIKRKIEENIGNIRTQVGHIQRQVQGFNTDLPARIKEIFTSRKNELIKQRGVLDQLGIPIRRRTGTPDTFTIPTLQMKKKIIPKPEVPTTNSNSSLDPTLGQDIYQDILTILRDAGREMERLPALYKNKTEPELRDHLLFLLSSHFVGSTTAETFNNQGKTDILLRHEGKNVFITECKFWSGASDYQKSIDQILGYLTWRDSKAALIQFVTNKEFTPVLQTVSDATQVHTNFISKIDDRDEGTWQNYRIHLNGDKDRQIYLAVLLFHLPR